MSTIIKTINEKYIDENHYDSFNYELTNRIVIGDSADATEFMGAVYKAMVVAGYDTHSIAQAMYNYADYLAFNYNFELKLEDECDCECECE